MNGSERLRAEYPLTPDEAREEWLLANLAAYLGDALRELRSSQKYRTPLAEEYLARQKADHALLRLDAWGQE